MLSEEYGCTYHYPFSPRTTSDDRINRTHQEDIRKVSTLVHTEKLDGENDYLNRHGVFARSYAALTVSPWMNQLRQRWGLLKNDLGGTELLGENLYAVHSIEYKRLGMHFYVLATHCLDKWLPREEVRFYATLHGLPTVPELCTGQVDGLAAETLEQHTIYLAGKSSVLGSCDVLAGMNRTHERVVTRNIGKYLITGFVHSVSKYARQGHVQIDGYWARHWKRVRLVWESK